MTRHDVSLEIQSLPKPPKHAGLKDHTTDQPSIPQPELSAPCKAFAQRNSSAVVPDQSLPAANVAPPEIMLQIYSMLTPRDFDNARRTCSQWMRASLNRGLLESMLKRAGWWDAYQEDCEMQRLRRRSSSEESDVWRMSKRFATECLLSGRKANIERSGFVATELVDFSGLAQRLSKPRSRPIRDKYTHSVPTFSVSSCSNYLLATTGCMIYVFHLHEKKAKRGSENTDIEPISSIECPFEVLSATLDTTTPQVVLAALLSNRVGMVCDLDLHEIPNNKQNTSPSGSTRANSSKKTSSPHYYYDVCTADHPPRTIALCPKRRCVAFGCAGGIEIHWVDETKQSQRRHFPMSQPSEILHFLPNTPEAPKDLRLISSLAGPGVHEYVKSFGRRGSSTSSNLSFVRATHCHHYRAVPINDGFHVIFVEPRTGLLCIGSDAPIGGPTSLTRAFVCIPPFGKDAPDSMKEARVPTAFAVGSDLRWGLRVVASYQDRIVLYSIPLDVFNVIRKERERQGDGVMGDSDLARDWLLDSERFRKRRESLVQNQNGEWEFLLSVSYRPTALMWPFKIYGKEIGRVENIVELGLQSSHGGARIWAFNASGVGTIFDIDTFSSANDGVDLPCKMVTVGSDGKLLPVRPINRADYSVSPLPDSRKRKASVLQDGFVGRYGLSRYVPSTALDGLEPTNAFYAGMQKGDSVRRPSFAACIVDFKIPELELRNGPWSDCRK
ncbi:uncharacterized protein N7477_006139 [Penicillium maclennaniae]|uniref:uncharacterized protein n=1 Tax=Penicillium maclennaniae TaxID=1343394 RepID=UPI002541AF04|nr:uncharacterized protein N7477_006139 [Penicillium maclennaniae]KAJ5670776.1 hypothetical protein N7477_006139 [Penicillium maclennaniae]